MGIKQAVTLLFILVFIFLNRAFFSFLCYSKDYNRRCAGESGIRPYPLGVPGLSIILHKDTDVLFEHKAWNMVGSQRS